MREIGLWSIKETSGREKISVQTVTDFYHSWKSGGVQGKRKEYRQAGAWGCHGPIQGRTEYGGICFYGFPSWGRGAV